MSKSTEKRYTVAGIGEVLWDLFETGKRLGGAPLNFCYHCSQLGAEAYPISAVGADQLGEEILEACNSKGISNQYLSTLSNVPTGVVDVVLDGMGKPSYEIHEDVAWDFIPTFEDLKHVAQGFDAICFGSLAQRNEVSRKTIMQVMDSMNPEALKIFDVNLRLEYFSLPIIRESLIRCNVLKLNDEELPLLAEYFDYQGSIEEQLRLLIHQFDLELVVYTRGPEGSLLISKEQMDDFPGTDGPIVNTVGAGDSFTATICMGLLEGKDLNVINEHANQVATYVCSKDTATPELPEFLKRGNPNES